MVLKYGTIVWNAFVGQLCCTLESFFGYQKLLQRNGRLLPGTGRKNWKVSSENRKASLEEVESFLQRTLFIHTQVSEKSFV